jgi:hypothetical protein
MKQATVSFIMVKSHKSLCILMACIHSYLKSVLRYKFLILDTCHPDTLYLREQGERLRWSRGSVLAFGTQVREFTPGRSRRIFRAKKKHPQHASASKAVGPMS